MHIKLLQPVQLKGHDKPLKKGWVGDHDDDESKALIQVGYAQEVKGGEKKAEKGPPENKKVPGAPENK